MYVRNIGSLKRKMGLMSRRPAQAWRTVLQNVALKSKSGKKREREKM